ncbi:methylated-DNA--[protein]-cysteine S-methyltransferase [Eubacteriales bacterium OttesenSCG-928-G02]|nr:methylated-DNA--[protein]-cysteine S-methyltransferase [Eubacteriales bacterium OttesenSCG-928-G02]
MYKKTISSPIGKITLAGTDTYLAGLWIEGQKHFEYNLGEFLEGTSRATEQAEAWLDMYFNNKIPNINIVLRPNGTEYRKTIWEILCDIPYGEIISYGQIAEMYKHKTGNKTSARAVGNAVGYNPISIIIPCHRVLGADKSMTGYAGGIGKKMFLLELEDKVIKTYKNR